EQLLCERATRDTRGGFSRRRPFEDVAQIANVILQAARKICMAGTRAFQTARLFGRNFARLRRHDVSPVGPIFVFDQECERRAEGETMSDAAQYLSVIALDLHAAAAAIAELAAAQLVIDQFLIDRHASR